MAIKHLQEHVHGFVRKSDNRVIAVAVFDGHDSENIESTNQSIDGDTYVVCGCDHGYPPLHATFDGSEFTPADETYLKSIGLLQEPIVEPIDEAKVAAKQAVLDKLGLTAEEIATLLG